jgi:hypothetical protein
MAESPPTWPRGWGSPRLLTRAQVRGYLQCNDSELTARMERGQLPGPLWKCDAALPSARWDRAALDRAINRASAIPASIDAAVEELDRALATRQT